MFGTTNSPKEITTRQTFGQKHTRELKDETVEREPRKGAILYVCQASIEMGGSDYDAHTCGPAWQIGGCLQLPSASGCTIRLKCCNSALLVRDCRYTFSLSRTFREITGPFTSGRTAFFTNRPDKDTILEIQMAPKRGVRIYSDWSLYLRSKPPRHLK